MPKSMTILRTCPSCGHRFRVKLVSETLLSDQRASEPIGRDQGASIFGYPTPINAAVLRMGRYTIHSPSAGSQEKGRFTTKRKEFEDSFKCARCGHQWSEKRTEASDLR